MSAQSIPDISVIIPVYRSGATLRELVDRLRQALDGSGRSYEIVFVDDGSPDESWQVLKELQAAHADRVVAVQLMRNFGQHNALMCGFHHARGRYLVTMDDDLQNPPEEIGKLLSRIEETGDDMVYGIPERRRHDWWRNIGSRLVLWFYRKVFSLPMDPSSYRIIRREAVQAILRYDLNFTIIDGLLAWNTRRIGHVTVEHHPRPSGRSGYSLGKLLLVAMNLFTNFSLLPLQLVSLAGLVASLGGFAVGTYYLVQYLFGAIDVPGFASIIVAILVLGGLQMLALGIIGEYLGRVHLNINRKPQYSVREVLGPAAAATTRGQGLHGGQDSPATTEDQTPQPESPRTPDPSP